MGGREAAMLASLGSDVALLATNPIDVRAISSDEVEIPVDDDSDLPSYPNPNAISLFVRFTVRAPTPSKSNGGSQPLGMSWFRYRACRALSFGWRISLEQAIEQVAM